MSVSGIGGGAGTTLYQQMLKRAQKEEAAQAQHLRGLNERPDANVGNGKDGVGSKESGGGEPEITKTTRDKDKKTPKELMEEMLERIAEKRQEEKLEAERVAKKTAAEEAAATGTILDIVA